MRGKNNDEKLLQIWWDKGDDERYKQKVHQQNN